MQGGTASGDRNCLFVFECLYLKEAISKRDYQNLSVRSELCVFPICPCFMAHIWFALLIEHHVDQLDPSTSSAKFIY